MEAITTTNPTLPRILLVEDDPISSLFLQQALRAVPANVDVTGTSEGACALAALNRFDAWLIDAHLPDAHGADLLARLRLLDAATVALAHTASTDADLAQRLISAGFREVLVKPLQATEVRSAVRRALCQGGSVGEPDAGLRWTSSPVWDDEAALAALHGETTNVAALRDLFTTELSGTHQRVVLAARERDHDRLHAELHRLQASCGLVGAAQLALATQRLHKDMWTPARLREFEDAVRGTLATKGRPALWA